MAIIFNITFAISPEMESDFTEWLKSEALPVLAGGSCGAGKPRFLKLVGAGGASLPEGSALSIAVQKEFEYQGDVEKWCCAFLEDVTVPFMREFGPEAAFFTTTLETLEP